jgi:hypothetical protein
MTAMFPDSGVPASDAKNSLPNPSTVNCNPLWYSTSRCEPRFDPAAANAMLAELLNLINRGEVVYDCARLDNIERAARYLVQRGIPKGAYLLDGPQYYRTNLDPPATRYNDLMTLTVMPGQNNSGPVWINLENLGYVPLLRNDAHQLQARDMLAGIPMIISYWEGNWFVCGLVASQVPVLPPPAPGPISSLDCWIRPDGNDNNDGTANSPDKAFQTIAGCWKAVGTRFMATPLFQLNMRLGVPATYAGANIGPFGGQIHLWGDVYNPAGYIITSVDIGNGNQGNFTIGGVNFFNMHGVTMTMDYAGPNRDWVLSIRGGLVMLQECHVECRVSSPSGFIFTIGDSGELMFDQGNFVCHGNGATIQSFMWLFDKGSFIGTDRPAGVTVYISDFNFQDCGMSVQALSIAEWQNCRTAYSNLNGVGYSVDRNSILAQHGTPTLGSGGSTSSGGQFLP